MQTISVINTIIVPNGMETIAEEVRDEYVLYFSKKEGFVSSTFYKSINREDDGSSKYINIVVWESYAHFEKVVNSGFHNDIGENNEGMRVLGKGFPEPIKVSPGQYTILKKTNATQV
ncbi:antibiotic biosynthesis monooxygenase family protein [Microbulbifer variabilis]|uniref:antibiotic biosynthesis monooxygenase family protein n=1 Tax=Microbulbifer variabilis TaxID=266805 RepID=UPI001CFC5717|nr:antibiotic biosynthesis monooxygenase [Microbulbifer variabilis]